MWTVAPALQLMAVVTHGGPFIYFFVSQKKPKPTKQNNELFGTDVAFSKCYHDLRSVTDTHCLNEICMSSLFYVLMSNHRITSEGAGAAGSSY